MSWLSERINKYVEKRKCGVVLYIRKPKFGCSSRGYGKVLLNRCLETKRVRTHTRK